MLPDQPVRGHSFECRFLCQLLIGMAAAYALLHESKPRLVLGICGTSICIVITVCDSTVSQHARSQVLAVQAASSHAVIGAELCGPGRLLREGPSQSDVIVLLPCARAW